MVDIDPAEHGAHRGRNCLREDFATGKNCARSGHGQRLKEFSARSTGVKTFSMI